MNGAHAAPLEFGLQSQIEVRSVDTDEEGHFGGQQPAPQLPAHAKQCRQVRQHFDQATDCELLQWKPDFTTGRRHAGPGNAHEPDPGIGGAYRADQLGGKRIARRLARDDADRHARLASGHDQRMMPRPDAARNSASGASTGVSTAAAATFAFASSSVKFSRYSILYARLTARMSSAAKPRRRSPSLLVP